MKFINSLKGLPRMLSRPYTSYKPATSLTSKLTLYEHATSQAITQSDSGKNNPRFGSTTSMYVRSIIESLNLDKSVLDSTLIEYISTLNKVNIKNHLLNLLIQHQQFLHYMIHYLEKQ